MTTKVPSVLPFGWIIWKSTQHSRGIWASTIPIGLEAGQ